MQTGASAVEEVLGIPTRATIVNRYAMPFAVLTVCLGVALGAPVGNAGRISIALLLFSALFNLASPSILEATARHEAFVRMRMAVNLICNGAVVWLLGGVWTPCWLLLALTPLAAAIYGGREKTLTLACGVSAFLLVRYWALGVFSPLDLGEQLTYCAFIILGSLMVNEAVHTAGARPPLRVPACEPPLNARPRQNGGAVHPMKWAI